MNQEASIVYGNENFHYAKIKTGTNGELSFDTPIPLPGMRGFSMEVEQSTKKIPADNKTVMQIAGKKAREATGTFLNFSEDYAQMLGYHKNANGMMTDTGRQESHAIMFEEVVTTETNETRRLHILYQVTAGEPSMESETLDEEVEERELEFNYSPIASRFVKDDQGRYVQYAFIDRTPENETFYNGFTKRVLLPTDGLKTV